MMNLTLDPLFLDALKRELDEIKELKQHSTIEKKVLEYQKKLASLTFLESTLQRLIQFNDLPRLAA